MNFTSDEIPRAIYSKLVEILRSVDSLHGDNTLPPGELDPGVNFYEVYGIDSLTGVAFVIEVQRFFKIRIQREVAEKMMTLSSFIALIENSYRDLSNEA